MNIKRCGRFAECASIRRHTAIAVPISLVNVDVVANFASFFGAQQLQLDTNQWPDIMLPLRYSQHIVTWEERKNVQLFVKYSCNCYMFILHWHCSWSIFSQDCYCKC